MHWVFLPVLKALLISVGWLRAKGVLPVYKNIVVMKSFIFS